LLAYGDHTYLIRAIEYLRHVEGEKHLVFLLEHGVQLGQGDFIARKATGARVTISVIQTDGVPAMPMFRGRLVPRSYGPAGDPDMNSFLADGNLAEQTGGRAAFYQDTRKPLTWLAHATSFEYLLGYYPASLPADGEYRHLRIALNRRGLTVLYRHGYEARPTLDEPYDVRRIFTESRIRQAASSSRAWPYIPTKLSASVMRGQSDGEVVRVDMAIDPSRVTFKRTGDRYTASLDVAVFVGDVQEKPVGKKWGRIDLNLDASGYARLQREHILRSETVNVTGHPAHVKVVLYEYDVDRLATAMLRLHQ
jgi:hypothetical protein